MSKDSNIHGFHTNIKLTEFVYLLHSFACGENWHDPVKCKWLRKWIKKCDDDSETSNWIAANTKVHINPNLKVKIFKSKFWNFLFHL